MVIKGGILGLNSVILESQTVPVKVPARVDETRGRGTCGLSRGVGDAARVREARVGWGFDSAYGEPAQGFAVAAYLQLEDVESKSGANGLPDSRPVLESS